MYTSFLLVFLFLNSAAAQEGWTVEKYPNPTKDADACHMQFRSSICDPDNLLSRHAKEELFQMIEHIQKEVKVKDCSNSGAAYEFAIAIADSVNYDYIIAQGGKEKAIQSFAKRLHDNWGVGNAQCQTGIVLFLSRAQRFMYVSTGAGVKNVLKNSYIDEIIDRMKEKLRARDFDGALIQAAEDVTRVLEKGYVVDNTMTYIIIALLLSVGCYGAYASWQKQKEYDEARRRLSEMQKREAQRLENNFEIESCMVCFEEFPAPGVQRDQKTRLLRCGHRFCRQCIASWEEQRHHTCPLCRKNMYDDDDEDNDNNNDPRRPMNRGNHSTHSSDPWEGCNASSAHYGSYRQELRRHRFQRLNHLYPDFVTDSLIRTWMRPDYRGNYAQDRTFRSHNPQTRASSSSGGRSSSFGGGSSSGGSGSGGGW